MWLAELDKIRPVVVMTHDPMGRLLSAVLVAPVTSTVRGVLSTEVPVDTQDGIRRTSVANVENLQLVAGTAWFAGGAGETSTMSCCALLCRLRSTAAGRCT